MSIRATGQLNLSSKQEPHRYLARLTSQMHTATSRPLMWSLHVSTWQIWKERNFCTVQTKSGQISMDLASPIALHKIKYGQLNPNFLITYNF